MIKIQNIRAVEDHQTDDLMIQKMSYIYREELWRKEKADQSCYSIKVVDFLFIKNWEEEEKKWSKLQLLIIIYIVNFKW